MRRMINQLSRLLHEHSVKYETDEIVELTRCNDKIKIIDLGEEYLTVIEVLLLKYMLFMAKTEKPNFRNGIFCEYNPQTGEVIVGKKHKKFNFVKQIDVLKEELNQYIYFDKTKYLLTIGYINCKYGIFYVDENSNYLFITTEREVYFEIETPVISSYLNLIIKESKKLMMNTPLNKTKNNHKMGKLNDKCHTTNKIRDNL